VREERRGYAGRMPLFDHLGITVDDLDRAAEQFDPVFAALGLEREPGEAEGGIAWYKAGETEIILYRAREDGTAPHRHGRVGWQHLAFAVDSREEVDRLHRVAVAAGWTVVRDPKVYPRFSPSYYASFVEEDNGIRIEFMHNPPRDAE